MPANICLPLFDGGSEPLSYRATAAVVGKTFAAISGDIQSGPAVTSTSLPTTFDGGNFQAATCAAGAKPVGVFAYDGVSGQLMPVLKRGNIVPVTAGGSITAGVEVEVGASGKAITLAAGKVAGIAHTSAVLNADVYVELY